MTFAPGSLVEARGREWVVLPQSDDELVRVRPLGGTDEEATGILVALEEVRPATFDLPDPTQPGDHRSASLLRDALRLGFRSSAGPFRSLGHIAVEPRPYQLVPLLMALRMDPVRLLVADDVGIGKSIEAGLIARELIEQGDVTRLAVLCPPHLAEQWHAELAEKFHLDATLVLATTAARLERGLSYGRTIFDEHPIVIVSTDFIKADRRRADFVRTCPELVIVDEAHTCARDARESRRGRHQRNELISRLAAEPNRHLILVTATPHSGKEGAFRSLLGLLDPRFESLPDDLSGEHNRRHREDLARHLVQRRRADVRDLVDDTPFPERDETEVTYRLSPEYRQLFDKVLAYAQEIVLDPAGGAHRQRVRWWSALALLRSLASSPAAAAATLRTRAAGAETATVEEADEVGRQTVLDLDADDAEPTDVVAGADAYDEPDGKGGRDAGTRTRLRNFAREAERLSGDADVKLIHATKLVRELMARGNQPIVFCRYIATAEYVASELRQRLGKRVEVTAVTGKLPPAEREARVDTLGGHERRVLVSTDCLSEGANLQEHFDAVFHYDLPWNPTRLEQREGRVDRFGQPKPRVRVVTYYGEDSGIDNVVLQVLLRKHRTIRNTLGISIPVPGSTDDVIEAVAEGLLARGSGSLEQMLPGMEEWLAPRTEQLLLDWETAADREDRSRSVFAQHAIDPTEVAREVAEVRDVIGSHTAVADLVSNAVTLVGGRIVGPDDAADNAAADIAAGGFEAGPRHHGPITLDLTEADPAVRDALAGVERLAGRFDLPVGEGEQHLSRTHPVVAGLASYVLDSALDARSDAPARRCGVIRTNAVGIRTTLLLVRHRFNLMVSRRGQEHPLVAEDCRVLAFSGSPDDPTWIDDTITVEHLLAARPTANVPTGQATGFITGVIEAADHWRSHVDHDARSRAEQLRDAHLRVRAAARIRGVRVTVTPQLPADILGIYVYLPEPGA